MRGISWFILEIWVCVKTYIIINVSLSGVNTTINSSYFDVNKRATFGFDPKPTSSFLSFPAAVQGIRGRESEHANQAQQEQVHHVDSLHKGERWRDHQPVRGYSGNVRGYLQVRNFQDLSS